MNVKRLIVMTIVLLAVFSLPGIAQNRTVTGKITDSKDGSPLANATVTVKGTQLATQTAADGSFKINNVPTDSKTLIISFVGYEVQQVPIGSGNIAANLRATNTIGNEVVVIGYGTARKKDLTGSVATVTAKDFNQGAITTPEQLIQGKVAGVSITSNGGAPGAGSVIRIRNGASLNASNNPLIVIDGVPLDNQTINGAANPLDMINPDDIESFTILKDASASAIYGSRASNGVIIITTKKGRGGNKFHLTFNTLLSLQTPEGYVKVMDTAQFKQAIRKYQPAYVGLLGNANTNWQKEIYQNALATTNNLSFNGGIKWLPYRLSLGYTGDDGILKTGYMNRESGTLNLSPTFFHNDLKVDLNVTGAITQNRFANEGAIGAADAFDPTQPVYSGNSQYDGYWEWTGASGPLTLASRNPVAQLYERQDLSTIKRSIGNIQLDYTIPFVKGLSANLNTGYDVSRSNGTVYQDSTGALSYYTKGDTRAYTQQIGNKVLDFSLFYNRDLKNINSHFDIKGGYSYQDVFNYAPASNDSNLLKTVALTSNPSDSTDLTLISFWGRMNYNYAGKYYITATLRDDGSSRFSPTNRWGLFPSVALAWNMKEENFLKDSRTFSALKLKLGYGVTGNQDIGSYYPYQPTYTLSTSTAQYSFGNTSYQTWRPNAYASNIKWEQQATYNIGVDYGFINNRLNGSIDLYDKKTSDLLATINVPVGTNFSNQITTNIGNMENKGVEFSINATPVQTKNFTWSAAYNFTYSTSKITNLSVPGDSSSFTLVTHGGISGGTGGTVQVYQVGYDPQEFYLYQQVYGANGAPLEGVYVDNQREGSPSLQYDKSATPKILMGFSSDFTYKHLSMGFTLRAELGNYVYNNTASNSYYGGMANGTGFLSNASTALLKDNFVSGEYLSDYFLENASFLKMDNVHVGYDFGKVIDKKVWVKVSATVQNVFTITKYSGLDPEAPGSANSGNNYSFGIDNNLYPIPRTYSLGVSLGY